MRHFTTLVLTNDVLLTFLSQNNFFKLCLISAIAARVKFYRALFYLKLRFIKVTFFRAICQQESGMSPDVSGEHKYRRRRQRSRRWRAEREWNEKGESGRGGKGNLVERRKSLERTKARDWHDESRVDVSFPANSRTMHTN